jgi:hypothetical protein
MAGLVLVSTAFLSEALLRGLDLPSALGIALVVAGCAFIVLAIVAQHYRIRTLLASMSLAVLSVVFTLAFGETIFRIAGWNFDALPAEVPIFNRPPDFHAGDGILRRRGPASWRGKPLSSLIQFSWGNKNAFPGEQSIEIRYDHLGFRNPPELTDWEVVVTGDSFVESGYLPYEDIFTTLAAERLGIRIKNLGVSGTGPVFQTAYVRNYGKAPSTRHAVLCFFDGNDVSDLFHEVQNTNFIRRTGHRMGRSKQSSMLVAIQDRVRRLTQLARRDQSQSNVMPNAFFVTSNQTYPVAVWPIPPPRWEDLKIERQEIVSAAFANWSDTVRAQRMQPWVMCIPDGRRVFQGYLRYADTNSPMAQWQSSEFGPHLARICAELDIRFIDTFPVLRHEVEAGRVPYNLFGDVHLSAAGSRVVAEVLADALQNEVQKRQ